MRSFERARPLAILGFGIFCILGNLYFTLDRSLILRSLDDRVVASEIGYEKHPGLDDVHWLVLEGGSRIHVDATLPAVIEEGDRLTKEPWSSSLMVGNNLHTLEPSADFTGMIPVMSATLLILILLTALTLKKIKPPPKTPNP